MVVVREARSADELLRAVAEEQPDLAVVDIRMPPGGNAGLTAALEDPGALRRWRACPRPVAIPGA